MFAHSDVCGFHSYPQYSEYPVPAGLPVNRTDKFQKLLMAVAEHTLPNDFTLQNVKSREQRRCPVSFYSHASLFPLVLFSLVVPVECDQALEFGFFIYAENYGMFRRVKIQPNNIFKFFNKMFVAAQFECSHKMRL